MQSLRKLVECLEHGLKMRRLGFHGARSNLHISGKNGSIEKDVAYLRLTIVVDASLRSTCGRSNPDPRSCVLPSIQPLFHNVGGFNLFVFQTPHDSEGVATFAGANTPANRIAIG